MLTALVTAAKITALSLLRSSVITRNDVAQQSDAKPRRKGWVMIQYAYVMTVTALFPIPDTREPRAQAGLGPKWLSRLYLG